MATPPFLRRVKADVEGDCVLGEGAFGQVLRGTTRSDGQPVALKQIRLQSVDDAELPISAVRELLALRVLPSHSNVVKLIGADTFGFGIVLVLELLPTDLHKLIDHASKADTRIPEGQISILTQMLLLGLEHCHKTGIMHRDLKPGNLLIR
jgi:serine/threonine protein kinase